MGEHSAVDRVMRHVVIGPYVRAMSLLRVRGREHLPRTGAAIVVANHQSFSDSLVLPLAAHRPVYFLGKAEYFEGSGLRAGVTSSFMRSMGVIPVDRRGGRAAVAALDAGREVLDQGRVFGIYPEGTRTSDGQLHRGRTGAARLAQLTGAPVIPCAIAGTARLQPPDARLLRPARATVTFGPPVGFDADLADLHPQRRLRAMTDEIMQSIQALGGLEYVDQYAPTRADADDRL